MDDPAAPERHNWFAAARRNTPIIIAGGGLAGLALGLALRRRDVPVLFYTATSPAESRSAALEAGAEDWLLKASVAWPELLRKIEEVCDAGGDGELAGEADSRSSDC